jgi:antitoxin component YwqK of YwqJK toxin-antitoxin module
MIAVYKKFFLMLGVTVLLCLSASVVWSETIQKDKLVWRDGITYKKFSIEPFTGTQVEFQTTGQLLNETPYVNGLKHGIEKEYFPNGTIHWRYDWINGKRENYNLQYYMNGNLEFKWAKKNGRDHGEILVYHNNGKLRQKGQAFEGIFTGDWKRYNKQGLLTEIVTYDKTGRMVKIEKWENGKLKKSTDY